MSDGPFRQRRHSTLEKLEALNRFYHLFKRRADEGAPESLLSLIIKISNEWVTTTAERAETPDEMKQVNKSMRRHRKKTTPRLKFHT